MRSSTSQNTNAVRSLPCAQGSTWKVSQWGIATMSDSSISAYPLMDEPSKAAPLSITLSSWRSGISTIFRLPRMSVNHNWMCFTFSSATTLRIAA